MFSLSKRSLDNLKGVDDRLVKVIKQAIQLTSIDFAVTEGLRSITRQEILFRNGASKTMQSKHIEGLAVDVVAYVNGRISWELPFYFKIGEAIREAADQQGVVIRWGGAWHINNICDTKMTMEEMNHQYILSRQSLGKKPFIDGPHFELN